MRAMRYLDNGVASALAAKLAELQGERTDDEFAGVLGCSREHWSNVRAGKRRVSYPMVKRIGRLYPELYAIVVRDLMSAEQVPA
jgi:plasmid maintenance system antidote protein VapI